MCVFFVAAGYDDYDKDDLHVYWEEYFKIFDIIIAEVRNSSLLYLELHFLIFFLILTSVTYYIREESCLTPF